MALGGGEHPKHRLTKYHDFFVERIRRGSHVLDIGCGYGAVARSIARRVEAVKVTGIDFDKRRIAEATSADNPPNLTFVTGDALDTLPDGPWDTVVLSNILEHIEGRVDFLRRIVQTARPRQVLIRVPLFERNWQIALRSVAAGSVALFERNWQIARERTRSRVLLGSDSSHRAHA